MNDLLSLTDFANRKIIRIVDTLVIPLMAKKGKEQASIPEAGVNRKSGSKAAGYRFLVAFVVLVILFYLMWGTDSFEQIIIHPVATFYANVTSPILNLLGFGTSVDGTKIFNNDFSINIKRGCDAIEAIVLFTICTLAVPAAWKTKLFGILAGTMALSVLNLLRLISLFLTGIYVPSLFDMMHNEVWQVLFIILAVVFWLIYVQKLQQQNVQLEE